MFTTLPMSPTAKYLCKDEHRPALKDFHDQFLEMNVPFKCVAEGRRKNVLGVKGARKHFVVSPESAFAHGADEHKLLKKHTHGLIPKCNKSEEDEAYKYHSNFIIEAIKKHLKK
jgi:hypothetical protein